MEVYACVECELNKLRCDITNATGGFLPNQQIDITIDPALNLRDDFLAKDQILNTQCRAS